MESNSKLATGPEISCNACYAADAPGEAISVGTKRIKLICTAAGIVLAALALVLNLWYPLKLFLFFGSYLLIGGDVLLRAVRNILHGHFFDENFLMVLATIGALAIGEYPESVAVMLFYQIGEFFQDLAVNRSRRSISTLMDIRPDYVNLKSGSQVQRVSPQDVRAGEIIVIKPGEKVPLDGKVLDGSSLLDTSALTGEPIPCAVVPGSDILSGSINKTGLLTVEVSREFSQSTVSRILNLVQNASTRKAPTENFITKFARYYTPAVVLISFAIAFIPPLFVTGIAFTEWINRALVFLVVSCPCALVLSIPLSFFGGIGCASRNGILIKGGNYLEALNNIDTVVFDKTGTLTRGIFRVTKIQGEGFVSEDELLEYAAFAESFSTHPVALSIRKEYGKETDMQLVTDYKEMAGLGVRVRVRGKQVLVGNGLLMERESISYRHTDYHGSTVHVALEDRYAGCILIADEVRDDSLPAVRALKKYGIRKLVMLTGDGHVPSEKVGKDLGLDEVYAGLLPDQKVEKLEWLEKNKKSKGKLLFLGDGINDAPVLARADVGVAMGGMGSDAAIEAADVVLMTDEPSRLVVAIQIAQRTRRLVIQNIVFALGIKGLVFVLGAIGMANMWEAVFADVGVALLAILNSMRILRFDSLRTMAGYPGRAETKTCTSVHTS